SRAGAGSSVARTVQRTPASAASRTAPAERAPGPEKRGALALLDRTIARLLPAVPRPIVARISSRYIAGSKLADACRVIRRLNDDGKLATVDVLGEAVSSEAE